jgi:hypothetical protein
MNVTNKGAKCSQLPAGESRPGGSPQKNSAEHEGYAGVHSPLWITETTSPMPACQKGDCSREYWTETI